MIRISLPVIGCGCPALPIGVSLSDGGHGLA